MGTALKLVLGIPLLIVLGLAGAAIGIVVGIAGLILGLLVGLAKLAFWIALPVLLVVWLVRRGARSRARERSCC